MASDDLRNVVVVGGSYVGLNTVQELAALLPENHRVILVEPHSHFHHLFAFPRFAVSGPVHKAFIPFTGVFPAGSRHRIVRARATSVALKLLQIDHPWGWKGSNVIPFDYLVVATGTRLAPPGTMPFDDKGECVDHLESFQGRIGEAKRIVIIGGGAVGVQMACDIKETWGHEKHVTLVHSSDKLMPRYHEALSNLIKERFEELEIKLVTGSRAVVPEERFPYTPGRQFKVKLQDGRSLLANYAILATGQTPNNRFLVKGLGEDVINPKNGFVRVKKTMQFADEQYKHLFAVGDIADSGAHKAARPGALQAAVAAKNIVAMIEGREPGEEIEVKPAGIHLTLGFYKNVVFRNPNTDAGDTEPFINFKEDGSSDMGIENVWKRQGVTVKSQQDYRL